mmetsp:Transcript_11175/g.18304  ORF Transcript_11175/g.18304 Transcript_11175/m.18304 type:complete len:1490 (-) Transcript_11175:3642-8111(-)
MSAAPKPVAEDVVVGIDGRPTNKRFQNMFEEEVVLTEKQKLRKELIDNKDKMKEFLKTMTPTDIFILFDEDDSGLISFEEFRKLLPYLDIYISDAKAFRYFRLCDSDESGEIDVDEFQVALFACDPTSGNPVGFQPSRNLTPMDAFEMFDEDQSGYLDEDEYRYAMEYLKIPILDEVLENAFFAKDYNFTGKIDYDEFRDIFIEVCDVRQELEDRDIDVPTLMRKKTMRKMLKEVLLEEEMKERKALAEARRHKQWILNIRETKKIIQKAEFLAYRELRSALDAAGHVYCIGSGAFGQFSAPALNSMQTKKFKFEFFDKVLELWNDRVRPEQLVDRLRSQRKNQEQEEERDAERLLSGLGAIAKSKVTRKAVIDPFVEAQQSPFAGLAVSVNTGALWGKRVHQVAVSENVLFALADTGEVFTWGGNSYWWHEIQPDSLYQTKWRGDTTARSQLLMNTMEKQLPPDASLEQSFDQLSAEDKKAEMIKIVAKYYNVWEPPPNPAQRMIYLEKDIMSKIIYDQAKFSLQCRGKQIGEMTKMQLVEALYQDIVLEKRLLGERAHKAIREIEIQVAGLQKRKKKKLADKFLKRIDEMWLPLREVQAENRAAELSKELAEVQERQVKVAQNYTDWRKRVQRKREDMGAEFTPRGNSLQIDIVGSTPRGPEPATPRGYQAGIQIASGTAHACLVHKSGQLYTWGVGAAGRLGLDLTEQGNPQADSSKPKLLQALAERPVIRVACGHSHTGAIVSGMSRNDLYMWGSTVSGKCGFGAVVASEECFCSIPTKVLVGKEDRSIKKLSCGSAHSAVVTEAGQLYVFGCGDGGRLGLGYGSLATRYEPTLVPALSRERIASVSCGNSTTLVSTEVHHEWIGEMAHRHRRLTGGVVYMAGSGNVLGEQYEDFTRLNLSSPDGEHIPAKQVSAGYLHSALVTADGEVYCWGHNRAGCCGQPLSVRFLDTPQSIQFFHTAPTNLALKKKAYQSSTFNERDAKYAVNGKKEGKGVNKATCTQLENQPWIEIDLGAMALIDKVLVWNRTDEPIDRNEPPDLYSSRLFPAWVMVGRDPFLKPADSMSLKENLKNAVCRAKLTENMRCSTWRCPANAQGRYVRVQLEKFQTLSVAEIEVYGYWGISRGVGRVSFIAAGRDVTVAVVRPSNDPKDVENMYKRAAYADARNADILRQFETFTLEYDKFGRGDVLMKDCPICKRLDKCECCCFYDTFERDVKRMPPVIGGRRRRLNSIGEFLINENKPPLQPIVVPKSDRPSKLQMKFNEWFGENGQSSFGFLKSMFGSSNKSYITPKEALDADPMAMMNELQYIQKLNDEKIKAKEKEQAKLKGVTPEPDVVKMADNLATIEDENFDSFLDDDEEAEADDDHDVGAIIDVSVTSSNNNVNQDSVAGHSSVGASVVPQLIPPSDKVHGYGKKNRDFQPGDTLPTGHKVKVAYPKSIAEEIGEKYEASQEWERKKEEEKIAAQKEKERRKSRMALSKTKSKK